MGQSQTNLKQNQDYRLIEQLPVGNIVKHNKTESLHFLKQYSFTAQQAYQNALNMHSLRLANKNQHILNFLHFTTKSQNSFCSSFHKIILIFEYSDHSLEKDIINRAREHQPFNQKEIWSILCSCVLAAVHLIHCQGKMHCGLTSKDIRLTSSGCIKLLSHQMIGIDSNHTQIQGIPKTLAITLIQCINLQKVTNQDDRYLQQMIQKLDSSRDMKEILILMLNRSITFVELEQHLFKLVQDDQSLASHSNTPVLKAQSPIHSENKQYKCPRINRNPSQAKFQTHMDSQQKRKAQQLATDSQDGRSFLFSLDQQFHEHENPDETDQPQDDQKQPQQSEQRPKQINSFYLKQRRVDNSMNNTQKLKQSIKSGRQAQKYKISNNNNNININRQLNSLNSMQNIKITKSYEINILQSSRRKENNQNMMGRNEPVSINNSIKSNNYQLNSIQSQDNLFTDPKLFSLIKSDLEDIKMRRSIGQLGKFTKTQQFVTTFNNIQRQPEFSQQNQNSITSYQVSQVKTVQTFTQNAIQRQTSTKILQQQQSKIKIIQPQSSPTSIQAPLVNQQHWFMQQKTLGPAQSSNGFKIQHTFNSNNMNGINNIEMIRQVSQQYRQDQQDKKSKNNRSTHQQFNQNNNKKQSPLQNKNQRQTNISKNQLQRIENIMSDNDLGFRKKKQSTAKFQPIKQNTAITQAPTIANSTIQQHPSNTTSVNNSNITSNAVHVSTHVSTQNNQENIKKQKEWFDQQNKSKVKGTLRQIQSQTQLSAHNSSNQQRYDQYFHEYSRSQSQSRLSSNPLRNDNKTKHKQTQKQKQNQKEGLVHVNENYTRGRYQGTKLNSKRHGYGTFYYSQGGKYVGNWRQNKMHGKGILYYPNQKVAYDGDWENDQLSGYGVLFNEQVTPLRNPFDYRDWTDVEDYWVKYQGYFYQDNKQGQGKLYIVNGERLEAQFHDDKVDGEGTLYRGDGSCVKGRWRQNKLVRMF